MNNNQMKYTIGKMNYEACLAIFSPLMQEFTCKITTRIQYAKYLLPIFSCHFFTEIIVEMKYVGLLFKNKYINTAAQNNFSPLYQVWHGMWV